MPSNSLLRWNGERSDALDEIENAHVMVGGTERGRRYATQQINYAYAALLSSHFQGFCRDLHSECVDQIVAAVPALFRLFLRMEFIWNRSLSRGNPHPGAIGSDFNRLGIDFWTEIDALDARNARRRYLLQELVDWRNAIAHQDFDSVVPGGVATLHLARVRGWRSVVNSLARVFDEAMYNYLKATVGANPLVRRLDHVGTKIPQGRSRSISIGPSYGFGRNQRRPRADWN
jgi:hypothetical protein